jgi:hypothetical protein
MNFIVNIRNYVMKIWILLQGFKNSIIIELNCFSQRENSFVKLKMVIVFICLNFIGLLVHSLHTALWY